MNVLVPVGDAGSLRLSAVLIALTMVWTPARETTLRVYLARHGQTEWNREGRLQGSTDISLNDTGRRQASMLRERLNGLHFDAVYTSDLKRSRETAAIVHGTAPVYSLAGLNERRLGSFEGRTSSPEYERRRQAPDDTLDGGESPSQFLARVNDALSGVLRRHRSGAILIIGHGGTNQMIVRTLFRLSAEQAATFNQANDDLYLCEIASGTATRFWKLVDPAR